MADPLRSTECAVFKSLQTALEDDFVVFYSRPWLGIDPNGIERDGECDFIVAHSELGVLALEVKGGAVAYDPSTERWTSTDRHQKKHLIKNPVQQVRSAKHEILKKLRASPHWRPRRIPARHGIVLPHSTTPVGELGADMPQRLFCFTERFVDDFRGWILERFGELPADEGPVKKMGQDGLHALEKTFAKPFQLRTPLGTWIAHDESTLEALTQQQFCIIQAIKNVSRAAISGGAGTGKTVLAIEEARRCAERNDRTLFVCYNRGLAMETRKHLKDVDSITVRTFHDLCAELMERARLSPPKNISKKQLFGEIFPELLIQAFENLPEERYDTIIADEGQDFLPLWWTAVEAGFRPEGPQLLRIFYDNNQRLYSSADNLPEEVSAIPIPLSRNLRNTQHIHEIARQYYTGPKIEAVGPEGVAVRWLTLHTEDNRKKGIVNCIERLHVREHIPPDHIAVLVDNTEAIRHISPDSRLGRFHTTACDVQEPGHIIVDSIRRFKGMESPVAIIAATQYTIAENDLLYVALSRARTHLIICGVAMVLNRIKRWTGIDFETEFSSR